jgi:phosphohistidine phosphatase
MKRLFLLRHAKSSWSAAALRDIDRPLNKRGKRDAPEMARRLAGRKHHPQQIVSSTAVRAMATATVFADALGLDGANLVPEDRLYGAGAIEMMDVIHRLDDALPRVMIVGHNPGMTDLVGLLGGVSIDNVPTCAVAEISFDTDHWANVGPAPGVLVDFDYPKRTQDRG